MLANWQNDLILGLILPAITTISRRKGTITKLRSVNGYFDITSFSQLFECVHFLIIIELIFRLFIFLLYLQITAKNIFTKSVCFKIPNNNKRGLSVIPKK